MAEPELEILGRKQGKLESLGEGLAQFHGFCNVGFAWGAGAALAVDTSNVFLGARAIKALREQTQEPLALIVYTHGHVDHIGGASAFLEDGEHRAHTRPTIWAHENLSARLERYTRTWGWNNEVNRQQFRFPQGVDAFPKRFVTPDATFRDHVTLDLAGEPVELHHARGETDDATWVWLPQRAVALVGDLSVQSIPNTGNPNKAQRYTLDWAEALDAIAERRPRHVIPGHGDPLSGDYALEVLQETARALRFLHDAVVERLNAGLWPDEVVDADIQLPADLARKPYLQPVYGCVPFVIRDVLRSYAGWWGGNPAELIPAPREQVARDLVEVAGRDALLTRAQTLLASGEARRALHLAMHLVQADRQDREAGSLAARICEALVQAEPSFIVRSFYRAAAERARAS